MGPGAAGDVAMAEAEDRVVEDDHENMLRARNYQDELLLKALEQDSIVYLPTGSGKTFIATMMIRHFDHQIRDCSKRSVFLVNTVPLAMQQSRALADNVPHTFNVKSLCGEDGVDGWKESEWERELRNQHILVLVHQVFLDGLMRGFLRVDDVNLIVMDECHHCSGDHPYAQIMDHVREYVETHSRAKPRFLGLTASIVTEKVDTKKFIELKESLEKRTDSKVITTENMEELLQFVTSPHESFLPYDSDRSEFKLVKGEIVQATARIRRLLKLRLEEMSKTYGKNKTAHERAKKKAERRAKSATKLLIKIETTFEEIGIYGVNEILDGFVRDGNKYACKFRIGLFEAVQNALNQIKRFIQKEFEKEGLGGFAKLEYFSSSGVRELLKLLEREGLASRDASLARESGSPEDISSGESNLTAIVFVEERQTALALAKLLQNAAKLRPELSFLRPDFIMSAAAKTFGKSKFHERDQDRDFLEDEEADELDIMEESRKNVMKLNDFAERKTNCLVSTAVLEEGIDVKKCNLVVRFQKIATFRSYVQSKGRARAKPSKFIMMVQKEDHKKYETEIEEYRSIERSIIHLCHGDVDVPAKCIADSEQPEVYKVNPDDPNSALATSLSAVSLVHRYVQSMHCDRFITLAPHWEFEHIAARPSAQSALWQALKGHGLSFPNDASKGGGIVCILHLPHLAPIKVPIRGKTKPTETEAKRSAALIAVERLHKMGELTDHLTVKRAVAADDSDSEDEDDDAPNAPKRGTRRRKDYYERRVSDQLRSLCPSGTMFLYQINLEQVDKTDLAPDRYRPEKHERMLGMALGQQLPEVALSAFHLHMPQGEVTVRLKLVGQVTWSREQFENVLHFQRVVFEDVLNLIESWFQPDSKSTEPLIVPLNGQGVDWCFVEQTRDHVKTKREHVFDESHFADAVVIPLHRESGRFFVKRIAWDMSPSSLVPGSNASFAEHYERKYDLTLKCKDQPLLGVRGADKRHPMLNKIEGKTSQKQGAKGEEMMFLPELVSVHVVSASLWKQCQALPFVLHRINAILNAHELLQSLSSQTDLLYRAQNKVLGFETAPKPDKQLFSRLLSFDGSNRSPNLTSIVRVLTLTGANERFDLEREEILGDSFLKFATSVHLFFTKKTVLREGELTILRSKLVSNKNLFNLGTKLELQALMQAETFEPHRNWRPPRYSSIPSDLEQKLCEADLEYRHRPRDATNETKTGGGFFDCITAEDIEEMLEVLGSSSVGEAVADLADTKLSDYHCQKKCLRPRQLRLISDKSVADCVEALIGAFLLESGQKGALRIMAQLGLDVSNDGDVAFTGWFPPPPHAFPQSVLECIDIATVSQEMSGLAKQLDMAAIERIIGYTFREKSFLLQAFTHASYNLNTITDSYERLEFLGDAVLDYLVTCYLFSSFPDKTPGEVTELRSALVNNRTLAGLTVKAELHKYILHYSNGVFRQIREYTRSLPSEDHAADDSKSIGEVTFHKEAEVEVPKILGDVLEAILGAVFIDSGMRLNECWRVLRRIFPLMDDCIRAGAKNPVKELYEKFPERISFKVLGTTRSGATEAAFQLMSLTDDNQYLTYKGTGKNKKAAKHAAAIVALRNHGQA